VGKDAAQLIATVIMQLILRAAYGREIDSTLWTVYADEFQHYVTGDIPEIIMNTRKYGVGLFLATQSFANIKDEAVRTALLAVGTLLCFQLTDPDARIVAGEFRKGVEIDEDWRLEQKRVFEYGEWYVHSETKYHRPQKSEVASRLANLRALVGQGNCLVKMGGHEHVIMITNMDPILAREAQVSRAGIIQRSREQYCRPRWEVERELRDVVWPDDRSVSIPTPEPEPEPPVLLDGPPPAWG